MSSKHELVDDGEVYLSHVLIKKRFGVSKKQLNDWAKDGKVRTLTREVARMPHQLMNDPQLELHFFHAGDVEKNRQAK
jgi:hypothetical protein